MRQWYLKQAPAIRLLITIVLWIIWWWLWILLAANFWDEQDRTPGMLLTKAVFMGALWTLIMNFRFVKSVFTGKKSENG